MDETTKSMRRTVTVELNFHHEGLRADRQLFVDGGDRREPSGETCVTIIIIIITDS